MMFAHRASASSLCIALIAALAACGSDPAEPIEEQELPITQLAIIGDSLASGFLVEPGQRYFDLLFENDDARFPAWAGRDLRSLAPEVELWDLAGPGDMGEDTIRQAFTVPSNRSGRTLVVFAISFNDLLRDPDRLLDPNGLIEIVDERAAQVRTIAGRFADTSRFPHGATLVALEPVDSTDGTDRVSERLQDVQLCEAYATFVALGGLGMYNERVRASQAREGVQSLHLQEHFAGHGWHYDNPDGPAYDPADPSLWLADCWHPNARGQHEIRRLIWEQIVAPAAAPDIL